MPSRDTAPFGMVKPPDATPLGRIRNRPLTVLLDRVSPLLHLQHGLFTLEYPRRDLPSQVRFVGAPIEPSPPARLPAWWADVADATVPVVHVTQGTLADRDGHRERASAIRAEYARLDAGTRSADLVERMLDTVQSAPRASLT